MAERWQQDNLGPGAALDIAFTLDYNQHPEFGGLELSLRDYKPHTASREAASRVPVEAGCS
jgi:hypothetical protein